jgi:membrane-associated phospholipid phosphatase
VSSEATGGALEDGSRAAHEVLAGVPGASARRWLGWVSLISTLLFVVVTILVVSGVTRTGFDLPVERAVQHVPWGPLTYWMTLTNVTGGLIQDLFGAAVVVALFIWDRRAGWLMALGAIGSLLDEIVKISVARHRPTADLVTILNPTSGYSYPSGHALFFTWLALMLAVAIAPHVSPRWRVALWVVAALVIVFACIGRIWAGAHWPTDVVGGFLLGVAWSAFILWIPERWLPTPSRRWVPTRWRASRGSHA